MTAGRRFGADEDLHDLIDGGAKNGSSRSEMKPLNLEHLAQGELDVPIKRTTNPGNPCVRLCCAYIAYACDYAPKFCFTLGMVALLVPLYFLIVAVFFNPTEHFGVVPNDYSGITSQYDLTVGKIDHWCLKGDNESCRCEDPLEPQSRGEFRAWAKAQTANTALVQSLIADGKTNPDICFLGGSVVEEMGGKWFGRENDNNLQSLKRLFQKNFQTESGASLDAVSLGIAGDTNPTILWRLMNGEMPVAFNPKIWWLEVGLNDLGRSQCSEEVVVLGVLRIVEEILSKKEDAIVVINSLFPLADLRGGLKPGQRDFKDGFDQTLRKKSTAKIDKIEKRHHKKRDRTANAQDDAGDTTHISHLKDEKKKKPKEGHKKKKKRKEGWRVLEESRETRALRLGRTKEAKDIKMKANKETQKKYRPIIHQERKLPLWTSITAVNRELRRFAGKHDRVIFFDSTEIFTDREDSDTFILKSDLISVRGHPSQKGFEDWEKAVVKKAKTLLSNPDI